MLSLKASSLSPNPKFSGQSAPGEQTIGQYVILSKIGQGGYGIIYKVRSLSKYDLSPAKPMFYFS